MDERRAMLTALICGMLLLGCGSDTTVEPGAPQGGAAATGGAGQGGASQGGAGQGGASQGGAAQGGAAGAGGSGTGGGGPDDPEGCAGCQDVIGDERSPLKLCAKNGPPSSTDVFQAVIACVCEVDCAAQCATSTCAGADATPACQACIASSCASEVGACEQDDLLAAPCVGCLDVLNGAPAADACTENGPPSSDELLDALLQCVCGPSGCAAECAASACTGNDPDASCQACVEAACATETAACIADAVAPSGGCIGCSDAVGQDVSPTSVCSDNGPPSSLELLQSMYDCVCDSGCSGPCTDTCANGGEPDAPCEACITTTCSAELDACASDSTPCRTCASRLEGGDEGELCTDNGPPSSAAIGAAMFECICSSGCPTECGQTLCVAGGDLTAACLTCVQTACATELATCAADD